jgi:ubiquinone/menaquinone biosynthesis C-methylase UbiE
LTPTGLAPGRHVLDVGSGSGGPACRLAQTTGCHVTGVDANEHGVATANRLALERGLAEGVRFLVADANARQPFEDAAFDALVCIDALNHFRDRLGLLREWQRVLRPGGRAVFTDPVVITGPVTSEELAQRSSIW